MIVEGGEGQYHSFFLAIFLYDYSGRNNFDKRSEYLEAVQGRWKIHVCTDTIH